MRAPTVGPSVITKSMLKRYVKDVDTFIRREVEILRYLDHANIIRMYESFEDSAKVHLVLELCEGGDLLERIIAERERLPEPEMAELVIQILCSIQHLSLKGIVHRDLKPENFLFTKREPEREPLPPSVAPMKLIDFGLSRRLSSRASVTFTPKIGTTEYMAPEVFCGGAIDVALADRMDMWSVGVIMHVIFVGHFPSPRLSSMGVDYYLSLPEWSGVSFRTATLPYR